MNPLRSPNFKIAREDAFTFVELLVVLATIGILAVLLLPALAGTKPNSQSFQCMQNQHQLTLGWQMYAADNADLLPPNDYPYLTAYASAGANQAKMKNWVVGTMANSFDAGDLPLLTGGVSELLDPNTLLSPYVKTREIYHCPADNYVDPYAGNRVHVRSYSMNAAVGTVFFSATTARPVGSPVGGGWLPGSGYNDSQKIWLTYGKMTSFNQPGPANTFVLIDENPRTINDAAFNASALATPGNTYLIDYPAGNHNGSAGISYADGHVIIHQWQDKRTYQVNITGQGNIVQGSTKLTPDDLDCFFLAPITSARR
jgi:prepilin-type processing-associated H-X9-DG protein